MAEEQFTLEVVHSGLISKRVRERACARVGLRHLTYDSAATAAEQLSKEGWVFHVKVIQTRSVQRGLWRDGELTTAGASKFKYKTRTKKG